MLGGDFGFFGALAAVFVAKFSVKRLEEWRG
jgi:hypothetical protein